ncbi:MAG: tRNA-dihydrouridine synthase family protein [Deltaproteobacteria bacterium]|nr:tRNA-dihydrouridine synthase family protein [Deltaproteobacteria bacterium]
MSPNLILAPLRGITEVEFRNIFVRFFPGFDRAVAPFISTFQGSKVKPAKFKDLLPENNTSLPVVPQILSKNADRFLATTAMLADLGYTTVNWNLGCPYPMVANKLRGSGLLPHPEMIESFLEKVCSQPLAVSVKIRLGRREAEEIYALLPIFNKFPLAEVIIHPRTGIQMYDGTVDLDTFGRCLELCRHPLVYNGDITSPAIYEKLAARFPTINSWMIGRGALANPFLPAQIKGCKLPDNPLRTLSDFHDALLTCYRDMLSGPSPVLGRLKGLWFYLAGSFADGRKILKKIQKTKKIEPYLEITREVFNHGSWQPEAGEENPWKP